MSSLALAPDTASQFSSGNFEEAPLSPLRRLMEEGLRESGAPSPTVVPIMIDIANPRVNNQATMVQQSSAFALRDTPLGYEA
jgi:pyruvate/2-oxoglutarate dehydrogenase complex dihydrolipoamide acyltransferase (E2) component